MHPEEHAYILQNADKRIVFVIPYQEHYSLIGTTDVAVDEYEHPAITEDEIDYLLRLVNSYLAKPLTRADVVWSYSGVRPLHDDGSADPAAVTRDYVIKVDALDGEPGPDRAPVVSIFGGKITTYRKLAEAALAHLAPYFPAHEAGVDAQCAVARRRPAEARSQCILRRLVPPVSAVVRGHSCADLRGGTGRARCASWVMRRRWPTWGRTSAPGSPRAKSTT